MKSKVQRFKAKMRTEGRSFKWFHKNYLSGVTYPYFIIQLNEEDRINTEVMEAIENFIKE
jgi:hypothetical protein